MTVKELKRIIEDLDDNIEVMVDLYDESGFDYAECEVRELITVDGIQSILRIY